MEPMSTPGWGWLLTSPLFFVSVAVLLLNDHVLKREFPGVVTGKLSDVAGIAMMAILATALLGRPRLACATIAVAFALLKTVPVVAVLAVPVLGGRTLTDSTDLIALLVLIPLVTWMERTGARRSAVANTTASTPILRILAIGVAVLATSATSCLETGIQSVTVVGERFVAVSDLGRFSSADGGRTWELADEGLPLRLPSTEFERACAEAVCFELDGFSVVRVEDGVRDVEYELSDAEVERLADNFENTCSSRGQLLDTIAVIDGEDGIAAVASMGEYGAVVRAADGTWAPVRIGDFGPERSSGGETLRWVVIAFVPALLAALLCLMFPVGLRARRVGRNVAGYAIGTFAGFVVAAMMYFVVFLIESIGTSTRIQPVLWIPVHLLVAAFGAMMLWLSGRPSETTMLQELPYPGVSSASMSGEPLPPSSTDWQP